MEEERKVVLLSNRGFGRTIGVSLAALKEAGHNVVIIDGEDANALKQAREDRLRAETVVIDNISMIAPLPEAHHIVRVKPHEIKYPVTRKSQFNQKKRKR